MLRLVIIAALISLVTPFETTRHLEDGITAPAFGFRQTFSSTPLRQHSPRAVLNILKRQNTCGTGFCSPQATCCRSRGCCPGGASCCSNGSCCQVSFGATGGGSARTNDDRLGHFVPENLEEEYVAVLLGKYVTARSLEQGRVLRLPVHKPGGHQLLQLL